MTLLRISVVILILLLGLMTGFFYAFSVTTMPGLDQTDPKSAIESMQGINRAVRNGVFFVTFFLTPVFAVVLAAISWQQTSLRAAARLSAAALTYLGGVLLLTMAINVPMNEALALIDTDSSANLSQIWTDYSPRWTFWNTARTIFNAISTIFATLALSALSADHCMRGAHR